MTIPGDGGTDYGDLQVVGSYQKWSPKGDQLTYLNALIVIIRTQPYHMMPRRVNCPHCGKKLYITDWLGFHQEMGEESAQDTVATTYMMIHETLLLFTAIRSIIGRKIKNSFLNAFL